LKEEGKELIFARAFLCLEWNIMARCKNVVHAHILRIEWNADSLVFCFVKSKGGQTGLNSVREWHVYANPHNHKICPVLALACYIFSNLGVFLAAVDDKVVEGGRAGTQKECLFPGGNQYGRFMDCLLRILAKYSEEIYALGILPGNLG
jgi:hypothetical protein